MINIPTEVKDALQKGSYKKNYRFSVLEIPSTPEDYYEIARIVQNQKYEIPSNGSYKIVGNSASSFSGVTTWVDGEEAEWFEPQVVNPTTEYDSYYNAGEIISVSGFVDIQYVSVMKWFEGKSGKEGFIIDNNNLVSESVSIDERMCSGKYLKFGLCEGSSLEFQYFGYPNITGRQVQALLDVEYEHIVQDEPVYYGTINQHDIPYTFVDAHTYQLKITEENDIVLLVKVLDAQGNIIDTCEVPQMGQRTMEVTVPVGARIVIEKPYDPEEMLYVTIEMTYTTSEPVKTLEWYTIPMGYFTVDKCAKQMSTGILKATAYNKLMSNYLDAKANSLITDSFSNPDFPVTFYDIRNVLLDNYEIEKSDFEKVSVTRAIMGAGTIRKLSGGAISLKAKYGIDSPFNYYNYSYPSTTASLSGYLFAVAYETKCEINATDAYTIQSDYDLDMLERYYFETISDLLSDSCSVTGNYMSRFINPQTQSSSTYDPYLGWHNYFGVCLEKSNGTKEWYSTIAYQNHLTGVVGTFSDLKNTTITDCVRIYFYIPYNLHLDGNASFTSDYSCIYHFSLPLSRPEGWQYHYYLDSSLTSLVTRYYSFKDINGEVIWSNRDNDWWAPTYRYTDISPADLIKVVPSQLPDITLREAASSTYELSCQYGQLDRETDLFYGAELNPDNSVTILRDNYSKLWYDEGGTQKFRYLIITYKGLDGQGNEQDYTLQRTINADGIQNYNMSDNWLFRNLTWTAEQVGAYADAMVEKMRDIEWMPFELWCAGLPNIQTGDFLWIQKEEGAEDYWCKSYVLQRTLKGIQNLEDTYIDGELDVF